MDWIFGLIAAIVLYIGTEYNLSSGIHPVIYSIVAGIVTFLIYKAVIVVKMKIRKKKGE
jgi:hypothetical protein